MTDDIEVIQRVIGGEVEAFRLLVERYQGAVFALLGGLLPRDDVEDLAQEVFLTAYTQLHRFDPSQAAFATWLLTIARNRGLNALKKRRPVPFAQVPEGADQRTPDQEAAELLRTAQAPIIVAVNKVDNTQREADAAEFWSMGWEETYSISASHGRGTGDLLDAIVWALPPESEAELARKTREDEADEWAREVDAGRLEPFVVGEPEPEEDDGGELDRFEGGQAAGGEIEARWDAAIEAESDDVQAAVAFVGRPNVGKSSLLNSLLGEDRAIVSDVPGTTRDAIDTTLEWGRSEIVLIDTAGIRRRGKVASGPAAEKYSTLRALKAIARADVAVLVIDAVEGLTAQDAHVAGYVVDEGKGLVIAVNKWDLVEDKTDRTFAQYTEWIRSEVPFLEFAPIISISAKTGQRVGKVLELAIDIWGERRKRIATGELNRVIRAAVERQSPPVVKGRRPKVFYGTQAAVAPPTFVFFANEAGLIHFSYRRYIENRLREEFGFDGTPIKLVFRDRESVKLPRRRSASKSPVSKGPSAKRPASGGLRAKR